MAERKKPSARGGRLDQGRYRAIVEAANSIIVTWDTAGTILFVNEYCARFFGFRKEELIGRSVVGTIVPETESSGRDLAALMRDIQRDPGRFRDTENENITRDGARVWIRWSNTAITDAAGTVTGIISVGNDVTARRKAEGQLLQMHGLMQYVISHAQSAIAVHDRDLRYIYVSEQYMQQYKVRERDVIGKHHYEVFPDLPQKWRDVHQRVLAGAVERCDEDPYVRADGSVEWTRWECRPWYERDGTIGGLIVYTEVITERKRTEEALRESEAKYRRLYNETPIMMHSIDSQGILLSVSNHWLRTLGYAREEVLGRRSTDFLDEPSRAYAREVVLPAFMRTGVCTDVPYTFVKKSGERIATLLSAIAERDEAGNLVRSLAVIIDVTERARAEAALRESEERFRDLAESLPLTVFEMDLAGRFTYVNRAALETFGYTREEFAAGLALNQVIAAGDRERARQGVSARLSGQLNGYHEYLALRKDGSTFPATVASSPILRAGAPAGLRGIVVNLTERRQLEEERLKAQKLESIGTLAGGIAHDFNNLLQGIFGFIAMAKLTLDQREKSRAMLEQAEKALHQSVNLTTQLLTFAKGGAPVKKPLPLLPVLENAVRFALSGSRSEHRIEGEPGLWLVDADEGQLGQVVQNIVLNADQAMPLGGTIVLAARNLAAGDPARPAGLKRQDYVVVSIRDTGAGMPREYLSRIFDPYFTTKENGSGLGLATSYSIVRNHDGLIEVESELGKGSTFHVYLPAAAAVAAATSPEAPAASTRRGRILLMDDEELVRNVAGALLTALGQTTVFADRGETALAAYRAAREDGTPFDAVILDLTIRGGMGGQETLRRLLEIDPGVKAIVSSGYSDDAALANYRQQGFRAFLKKPYRIDDLQATLSAVLA